MNAPKEKLGKKIIDVKILKKHVVIYFDDEDLKVSYQTYSDYLLYPNKIVTPSLLEEIKKKEILEVYLQSALRSLTRSHFSEQEIKKKLLDKGATYHQTNEVIKRLKESHLLNDEQLTKDLIFLYKSKGYGPKRIINSLKKKGLDHLINDQDLFTDDEQSDLAKKYFLQIEKKYRRYNYVNKKQKIYEAYFRLGYEPHVIKEIINDHLVFNLKEEKEALLNELNKIKRQKKKLTKQQTIDFLLSKGYRYNLINEILK